MNMNYNYPSTIWESIVAQMYKFLAVNIFFSNFGLKIVHGKSPKLKIIPEIQNWVKILAHIVVR